jgi:hypothetical protein
MATSMTLTTHALAGVVAASFFPDKPILAFVAGFASHFAIDSLPHYDYSEYLPSFVRDENSPLNNVMQRGAYFWRDMAIIALDALIGFVLVFVAARILGLSYEYALIGAGAGLYPDFLQFVYFNVRNTAYEPVVLELQKFHRYVQDGKNRIWWGWRKGFASQIMLILMLYVLVIIV